MGLCGFDGGRNWDAAIEACTTATPTRRSCGTRAGWKGRRRRWSSTSSCHRPARGRRAPDRAV